MRFFMKGTNLHRAWDWFRALFSALGAYIGAFLGGADALLTALIVFMCLDYITGVVCAVIGRKLSSAAGFRGICRKLLIIALVGMANVVDTNVLAAQGALRSAVICFYLSNEGLSVLENAARAGLPVPDRLKGALAQLRGKDDDPGEED